MLEIVPTLDSDAIAEARRRELLLPHDYAAELGRSAVAAAQRGYYTTDDGREVDWSDAVAAARNATISIRPDDALPDRQRPGHPRTRVQVANETTLGAARRRVDAGQRPLALNFANGVHPGGGVFSGALAQEENLCRSSALYVTLVDDPMYAFHQAHDGTASSSWAILSPDVPVFRSDHGAELGEPWLLSFITCAAPVADYHPNSADLLQQRIHRVLDIAAAYGYESLILGAWGCGAFGNDPERTARDFRGALETDFDGAFEEIVFAITDWSPERRFLGPFRAVFEEGVRS